jgi:hypothetical protein
VPLGDPLLELRFQPPELPRLAIELGEHLENGRARVARREHPTVRTGHSDFRFQVPVTRPSTVKGGGTAVSESRKRGADLVRNRRFESISLQRRVCCEPIPGSWLAPTRETPSRSCIPSRRQPTPASACWSTRFATVDENIGLEHSGMVAKTFHRRRTEMRHDLKRTLAATPSRKINHCVKKSKQNQLFTYYLFFNQIPKELTTLRTSAPREVVFNRVIHCFSGLIG